MRAVLLVFVTWIGCADDPPPVTRVPPRPTAVGTPTGPATTMTIGAAGGTIVSGDGVMTIVFPPGALASDTAVSIEPITNELRGAGWTAYRVGPDGITLAAPVNITMRFLPEDIEGSSIEALYIAYQDDDRIWRASRNPTRDAASATVAVSSPHLSDWSMVVGWQLRPPYARIRPGERVDLRAVSCSSPVEEEVLMALDYPAITDCQEAPVIPNEWLSNWAVNGVPRGNPTIGTVTPGGSDGLATYVAPIVVDEETTYAVSVTFGDPRLAPQLLVSNITVQQEGDYTVSIDSATFAASGAPCECGALGNRQLVVSAAGSASGPEGARLMLPVIQTTIESTNTCTDWTVSSCMLGTVCCTRDPGQPETTNWSIVNTEGGCCCVGPAAIGVQIAAPGGAIMAMDFENAYCS